MVIAAVSLSTISVQAQISPTPYFTSFYDDASTYNGEPLPVGTIITAFDQSGVLCGADTVHTLGNYGFMPVYGDDPGSPEDEGAVDAETIVFKINGKTATVESGDATFTDQANKQVRLSATGSVALTAIELPNSQAATFDDTIRFYVAIRNVQWTRRAMTLYAGGGITKGSQLDAEWEELQLKFGSIRSILGC